MATLPPLEVNPDYRPGMSWNREVVKRDSPDDRICFMANPGDRGDADELRRYAFLFAAAPELYEALQLIVSQLDRSHLAGSWTGMAAARAALAKVSG